MIADTPKAVNLASRKSLQSQSISRSPFPWSGLNSAYGVRASVNCATPPNWANSPSGTAALEALSYSWIV